MKKSDNDAVLRQTLEGMPHTKLVEILVKFTTEDEGFRRKLMEVITIPAQVIRQQPENPELVSQLKKQIKRFFDNIDRNLGEYYETGPLDEIDTFLDDIQLLNPLDQLILLPYLVETGEGVLDDYAFDTDQLAQTMTLYGEVAATLELSPGEKRPHFDTMLGWLGSQGIWEYSTQTECLYQGLAALAAGPEDYHYLCKRLTSLVEGVDPNSWPELADWLAAFYLKNGDEADYLNVREAHLENEAQYYELAIYWQNKGQPDKYLATLESWFKRLEEGERPWKNEFMFGYRLDDYSAVLDEHVKSGLIMEKLAGYYREADDKENLRRVLLGQATYYQATFELYQAIKGLSEQLGQWEAVREKFMTLAARDDELRAQIHLSEQDWDTALEIAREKNRYGYEVIDLVAQGIKQVRPAEAIQLYENLVAENIAEAKRKYYNFATGYAAKIKEIYLSILKDSATWESYINQIRAENKRRPALQEEFGNL